MAYSREASEEHNVVFVTNGAADCFPNSTDALHASRPQPAGTEFKRYAVIRRKYNVR